MPLLWRYLFYRFFKIFCLVAACFIFIIMTFRLSDIARFATLEGKLLKTLFFAFMQIPYIAPFAISFSALISSYLLSDHLSSSQELTSLRASGASILLIFSPLVGISCILGTLTFLIYSELTPLCRAKTESLLYHSAVDSPIQLLKKKKFMNVKNSFIDCELSEDGLEGENLIFAFLEQSKQTLCIGIAKKLVTEGTFIKGIQTSTISSLNATRQDPGCVLENYEGFKMSSKDLTSLLKKERKKRSEDQLKTKELLIKSRSSEKKQHSKCFVEIKKRVFFLLLPITFTVLGLLWGLKLGRSSSSSSFALFSGLLFFVFMGYFLGKSLTYLPFLSSLSFFSVHPIAIAIGLRKMVQIEKGIEKC